MNTTIDPTLLSIYSDTYKDVYGVRPRGPLGFTTETELREIMSDLQTQIENSIAMDQIIEEQSWKLVHGRITTCAIAKNCTWQEALQTLTDAEGAYDIDGFLFDYGVNYRIALKVIRLFEVEGSVLEYDIL